MNYSSGHEAAEWVVSQIRSEGGKAIAIQGDVSKSPDVQRIFAETKKAFGSIDVVVNNAGVFQFAALEEITEKEFHREFEINVLGMILVIQTFVYPNAWPTHLQWTAMMLVLLCRGAGAISLDHYLWQRYAGRLAL